MGKDKKGGGGGGGGGEEENLKVAVRVRPFNKREKDRKAKMIIEMNGATTKIQNPADGDFKTFTFDYSYWSFDGCKDKDGYSAPDSSHPNGKKYCDQVRTVEQISYKTVLPKSAKSTALSMTFVFQKMVFNDVGKGILNNAWNGYNSTLFAYGQTGSGKSWSVIGYGANKGLVPMVCEELFNGIEKQGGSGTTFEVKFSMLEIYNEVARDLLDGKPGGKKSGLKIRQHPKKGFYGTVEYSFHISYTIFFPRTTSAFFWEADNCCRFFCTPPFIVNVA